MSAAAEPLVVTTVENGVLVITINRPAKRNAVDGPTAALLAESFERLDSDDDLGVAILTGAGGNFSAGMDLSAFIRGGSPVIAGRGFGGITERPPRKPVIAAVEGFALAGGFEMVLACDLIVAGRTAQFGLPEVKRGLVAAAGGLLRLPHRIPYHAAMKVILTGDRLSAIDADRYGLLAELTEPGEALGAAKALAASIVVNAPLSIRFSKQIVADVAVPTTQENYRQQQELVAEIGTSADAQEGALAFTQKRAPVWTGR